MLLLPMTCLSEFLPTHDYVTFGYIPRVPTPSGRSWNLLGNFHDLESPGICQAAMQIAVFGFKIDMVLQTKIAIIVAIRYVF